MNEEIFNEEGVLEDTTLDENVLSSDQDNSLEEKLDRIEALLNEEITLRETEETENELEQEQGSERTVTGSGSINNDPDYSQYIYDLLTDSTIKVEVVEEKTIFDKQLNDYSVIEGVGVIGLMLGFGVLIGAFINRYTFKRR